MRMLPDGMPPRPQASARGSHDADAQAALAFALAGDTLSRSRVSLKQNQSQKRRVEATEKLRVVGPSVPDLKRIDERVFGWISADGTRAKRSALGSARIRAPERA